jgi:hypothetical protein
VNGSFIMESSGMIFATGETAHLAISGGFPAYGCEVKIARVVCNIPAAALGSTADMVFSFPRRLQIIWWQQGRLQRACSSRWERCRVSTGVYLRNPRESS